MLRLLSNVARVRANYTSLTNVYTGAIVCSNRNTSQAVQVATEKAKAEAREALKKVTDVLEDKGGPEPLYESEEYIKRHVSFFDRPEIDGWEIRRAIHRLTDYDAVPDPQIIIACLRACRRLNDLALAIRFLEVVKGKCGPYLNKFYPYILQEITPTLKELGISTPEELGWDKPELALQDTDDIH